MAASFFAQTVMIFGERLAAMGRTSRGGHRHD